MAASPDLSLKRLRELCRDIHQENIAYLLKTALPDFPIPVIDEFFTGPKINKPSGPDSREWSDLVRLAMIAFAPEGSEPARLRGKPFGRFLRACPYNPNSNDADPVGTLKLYPTIHTSPLLGAIARALGVVSLQVCTEAWLACYLADPFPITSLSIDFSRRDASQQTASPLPGDWAEMFAVFPDALESLAISCRDVPIPVGRADSVRRLTRLKRLKLGVHSMPQGLDLSANTSLEKFEIGLTKSCQGTIAGLAGLTKLQELAIRGASNYADPACTRVESLEPLLSRELERLALQNVVHLGETFCGRPPEALDFCGVSGIKRIKLEARKKSADQHGPNIRLSDLPDLEEIVFSEESAKDVDISGCPKLASIAAKFTANPYCELAVSGCKTLARIDAEFPEAANEIELSDLPALTEATFTAPRGCSGTSPSYHDRNFSEQSAKFFVCGTGLVRPPALKGGWKELSIVEFSGNERLETLEGVEVLPDLREIRLRGSRSMKALFPPSFPPLRSVTLLRAQGIRVPPPAGFEALPHLAKLELLDCSITSLAGVERMTALETVDISSSSIGSLAPLAGLPLLRSVKVSKCFALSPKPAHVLLEGLELVTELIRHAGPDHPAAARAPSQDLLKIVELIGDGARHDVAQALKLLPALPDDVRETLVAGAALDPKTGWLRLPYLSKIKEDVARGMPQLAILRAIGGETARRVLDSITGIAINGEAKEGAARLCLGKSKDYGTDDDVLEDFPSLAALPQLRNVKSIHVRHVSRFSLEGAEQFPELTSLVLDEVRQIAGAEKVALLQMLEHLSLWELPLEDLRVFGSLPRLTSLAIKGRIARLDGIENFPALTSFNCSYVEDFSALQSFASAKGCRLSCRGTWPMEAPILFELTSAG